MKKAAAVIAVCFGISAASFAIWRESTRHPAPPGNEIKGREPQPPTELPSGLSQADFDAARKLVHDRYGEKDATDAAIFIVAGEVARSRKDLETAMSCFSAVPLRDSQFGPAARLQLGLTAVEADRAVDCENALRDFIDAARLATRIRPEEVVDAFKWLNYVLSVQIRLEDRKPLLQELHDIGLADPLDSKQLFFPTLLLLNSPTGRTRLNQFLAKDPGNPQLRLAHARYQTLAGDFAAGLMELEKLEASEEPNRFITAAIAENYFESFNVPKFVELMKGLPPYAAHEPWALTRFRGEAALEEKQYKEAIELFSLVLLLDPTNAPSQMGLARAHGALGNKEAEAEALRRSKIISEIRVNLSSVQADAAVACDDLAAKCEAIDYQPAAEAFRKHAAAIRQSGNTKTGGPQTDAAPNKP